MTLCARNATPSSIGATFAEIRAARDGRLVLVRGEAAARHGLMSRLET